MQIEVEFDLLGLPTITAYCLRTDLWDDYIYFKKQLYEEGIKPRNKNRLLRVCLILLFSHIEATLNQIVKDDIYSNKIKKGKFWERIKKISAIHDIEFDSNKILNMKNIRNMLSHFGDKEEDEDRHPYNSLAISDLESTEHTMINWLEFLCQKSGITRLNDTETLLHGLAKSMSSSTPEIDEL